MAKKQRKSAPAESTDVPLIETLEAVGLTVLTEEDIEQPEELMAESIALQEEAETGTEVELTRQTVTQRCQEAKEQGACACRCRGKYHAKQHPDGWKDEPGCEPLSAEERKVAKRETLKAWRHNHPDRVSTYMKQWRETSAAATAVKARAAAAKKAVEAQGIQ